MASDIGELAENYFEQLAIKAGLTANRVTKDKEGWDFILQFPFRDDSTSPYDQRKPRIECLVQVKGTRTKKRTEPVSLTNWEKLVKTNFPVFFVIVEFGKDDQPLAVYLVHVGKEWVSRVLERLRLLAIDHNPLIHKKTLNLKWNGQDSLRPDYTSSLVSTIEQYSGDMETYFSSKNLWREQAGDHIPQLMTISKTGDENELLDELVNLSLGVISSIDVDSVVLAKNVRFGKPIEETELGPGSVSLKGFGATPIKLHFSCPDSSHTATFEAQAYSPYGFFPKEDIPIELFKFRITFPFGQLILRQAGETTVSWGISLEDLLKFERLQELVNIAKFLTIFDRASQGGVIVAISNDAASERLIEIPPTDAFSVDKNLALIIQAIYDAEFFVTKIFDLSSDLKLSISHILDDMYELKLCRLLLDVSHSAAMSRAHIHFNNVPGEVTEGLLKGIPVVSTIHFGDTSLTLGLALAGHVIEVVKNSEGDSTVSISEARIVASNRRVQPGSAEDCRAELFEELILTLQKNGFDTSSFSDPVNEQS